MHSKVNALGLVVQSIYMPSASTKLITELLIVMLVGLMFMGGQITNVTALPITSKPIETTAENLAWQAWLMLPLEQKNQIQSRKVTPKSIFLLPLRGDCPPDHHKVDFKCIPITSGTNAMLIDPNVLGLLVGDTNSTFDYDYENEPDEPLDTTITELTDANDYQGTTKSIRQDEPLKFNIFQNRFPTIYDEVNDDYYSLPPEIQIESFNITHQNELNITVNTTSFLDSTTEMINTTEFAVDVTRSTTNKADVPHEASTLFDDDTVRIINSAMGVENSNGQDNNEDIVLNVTFADILKKDALIPLHNNTGTTVLDENGEVSSGDMFHINSEQYDATTFSSVTEDTLNQFHNKSEPPSETSALASKLLDKLSAAYNFTPFEIYLPIVVRSKENLNEYSTKVLNTTKESASEQIESVQQSVASDEEEVPASTVTPLIINSMKYDNEFSTISNNKEYAKITPTASTKLITTLERNSELQTTTTAAATSKNNVEIELSSPTISSRGTGSFKQQTISEIYQIKEWRLINELATDTEQSDTTEQDVYEGTTKLKAFENVENIPLISRHISALNENIPRDLQPSKKSFSSITDTNSDTSTNNSSTTANDLLRLNSHNSPKAIRNAYSNTSTPLNETLTFQTLPVSNNNKYIESKQSDSSLRIRLPVETTTSQVPSKESEPIKYPIEPLLLKLWSAYKAAVRKRHL